MLHCSCWLSVTTTKWLCATQQGSINFLWSTLGSKATKNYLNKNYLNTKSVQYLDLQCTELVWYSDPNVIKQTLFDEITVGFLGESQSSKSENITLHHLLQSMNKKIDLLHVSIKFSKNLFDVKSLTFFGLFNHFRSTRMSNQSPKKMSNLLSVFVLLIL